MNAVVFAASVVVGANLWFLFEYLLHRFAMHELHGKGIMSREHLEHHVSAGWSFSYTHLLSWAGVGLVGAAVWFPVGWLVAGPAAAWGVALGWPLGYAFYEYEHAVAHLRPPRTSYQRWIRKNHFHHHFGKPMANHGVSVGWWDVVFGTQERPERVRVPRRFAHGLGWLLDDQGELRAEFAEDYELVGTLDGSERQQQIDRVKAFASVAPDA